MSELWRYQEWEEERRIEQAAFRLLDELADRIATEVAPIIWHIGDGEGGYIMERIRERCALAGYAPFPRQQRKRTLRAPKLSSVTRAKVWARDDFTCRDCGSKKNLTVDHIHPQSRGGTNDLENLQTLCNRCNSRKGVRV